jgi:amino acid permease
MIFLLIILPLTFLKTINALRFSSFFALLAVFYVVVMVIIHKFIDIQEERIRKTYQDYNISFSFFMAFPVKFFINY